MGAWIEISLIYIPNHFPQSHPTWVRGLKFAQFRLFPCQSQVAPHMGAWIEITSDSLFMLTPLVAPHMGAWIEICVPH